VSRESADARRPFSTAPTSCAFRPHERRVMRSDFTFRFKIQFKQIQVADSDARMPPCCINAEQRLDTTTRFRWKEQFLPQRSSPGHPLRLRNRRLESQSDPRHRGPYQLRTIPRTQPIARGRRLSTLAAAFRFAMARLPREKSS
jgi:hypothetical protein